MIIVYRSHRLLKFGLLYLNAMYRIRYSTLILIILIISNSLAQQTQVTVGPGDSLWSIALRYDTSVEELKKANSLVSDKLKIGAKLYLPMDSNSSPETYIVQEGDTLSDISVAFSLSLDDLIAFNDIDGSIIKPGQELLLSSPKPAPAFIKYEVASGDTLWSISRKYDIAVVDLIEANSLASDFLSVGLELTIPGRYAAQSTNQSASPDVGGAATLTIKVAKGDTLWKIANRYDTDISALMATNNLSSARINAGQTLRIVKGAELERATRETKSNTEASTTKQPEILASAKPAAASLNSFSKTLTLTPVMIWPLKGVITSKFGYRRLRIAGSNFHTGLDIDGVTGDPIKAAVPGEVVFAGRRGGYGKLVIVRAENGNLYYYAHCSKILVDEGQSVAIGEVIAKVGNTGRSTGSHLHFEIRVNNKAVDPLPLLEQYAADN